MYTNILIPVLIDAERNTETSFSTARMLGGAGCRFTILHVVEPMPAYFTTEIPVDLLAGHQDELRKVLEKVAEGMPEAQVKLISGHAGHTIVDYAAQHDVDCIVVNSHKPGLQDFLLGSTAARVVRHAKCAVHVIR